MFPNLPIGVENTGNSVPFVLNGSLIRSVAVRVVAGKSLIRIIASVV
jgi:hypothetical protein